MNRGELRTLIGNLVEDPSQTRFTAAKYNDAIEKAQQQFALDSKALYKDFPITMVARTGGYSLPTDFMYEKMVTLNGVELSPITKAELQRRKGSSAWSSDTGTPKWFIVDPDEAKKTITLYPIPDSTDAGTAIVLTYYPVPATLTADTSVPLNSSALMVQYHIGIAGYAAWLLMLYLTQTPEISQKRNDFIGMYSKAVNDAIQTFGNTKSAPLNFRVNNVRAR